MDVDETFATNLQLLGPSLWIRPDECPSWSNLVERYPGTIVFQRVGSTSGRLLKAQLRIVDSRAKFPLSEKWTNGYSQGPDLLLPKAKRSLRTNVKFNQCFEVPFAHFSALLFHTQQWGPFFAFANPTGATDFVEAKQDKILRVGSEGSGTNNWLCS